MSKTNQRAVFNEVRNYSKNDKVKTDEAKKTSNSGVLTLISSNFNFKNSSSIISSTENKKLRKDDVRAVLRNNQITKVRASMESELPGNAKNSLSFPRRVLVSVHCDATNPYVVISESDRKYARPLTCLRLTTCDVTTSGDRDFTLTTSPQSHKFEFRTPSTRSRDKWVKMLTSEELTRSEFSDSLSAVIEDDVTSGSEADSDVITDSDVTLSPSASPSRRRKSFKSFSKKLHSYEQNRPRWMTAS